MIERDARATSRQARLLNFPTSHVFRPDRAMGAGIAAGVAAVSSLLGLALVVRGLLRDVSFAAFGSLVIGATLIIIALFAAYWAYAILRLRYVVNDDSLVIIWGLARQTIGVNDIERIVLGRKYGEPRVAGLSWPGCHVGRGRVRRMGEVLFYSTHRSADQIIYLTASSGTFGLSPSDSRGLARAIQVAQDQSPDLVGTDTIEHQFASIQAVLADSRVIRLAAAALIACLIASGYIYSRYQSLPVSLALPYPPTVGPERIGLRRELMRLPVAALVWLLIGFGLAAWAHTRLRAVCYALLAGTFFAECLYIIGALAAAR